MGWSRVERPSTNRLFEMQPPFFCQSPLRLLYAHRKSEVIYSSVCAVISDG